LGDMAKDPKEWFIQAEYDMKTAEVMFDTKRYIYVVFMCHLSVEKALKGLYQKKFDIFPPKVHNLIYLIEKVDVSLSDTLYNLVFELNRASVPTRYPESLQKMNKDYTRKKTSELLANSKEVLKCLKREL
jgi:HEPN domain-containing protein